MGSKSNVTEKLWQAIDVLVTSEGRLQERLASAAINLTGIYLPLESDLPKKNQEEFKSIIQNLSKETAKGDEGAIQATTYKMNDQEAKQVARRILDLYIQLKGGI
jgi:hypothetical protein